MNLERTVGTVRAMAMGIIGGTGVYDLGIARTPDIIATPYGEAAIHRLVISEHPVVFLARHGAGHTIPPHRINYRANIWALHALGVREVLAIQAVGSMHPSIPPGHFALIDQFIDWTRGRIGTFFDGEHGPVRHVDVTAPYCPRLSARVTAAGAFLGDRLHTGTVYACTEGPRFETAAEIRALRLLGADVVGMTNVPEVVLAREAGLCYATLCIVCNWGAGISATPLTQAEVVEVMAEQTTALRQLFHTFLATADTKECSCTDLGFGDDLPQPGAVVL